MASLSVRRIDDELFGRLKRQADQNGVSVEEEARRILRRALSAPDKLGQFAVQCFGETYGVELEPPSRGGHEPLELED